MEEQPEAPRPASAARVWLRILAWTVPGISSPAVLLGGFVVGYGNPDYATAAGIGMFAVMITLVLGCGTFDILLRVRGPVSPAGEGAPRTGKHFAAQLAIFFAIQVVAVPLLGVTTATACNAVTNGI